MGVVGRRAVETNFSTEVWAGQLAGWFKELGPRKRPGQASEKSGVR